MTLDFPLQAIARLIVALFAAAVVHGDAEAQKIRVAISITEAASTRVFQSAFVGAFRGLGDVEVVSTAEKPNYVLTGVVICEPSDCTNPTGYSAALRFWSPVQEVTASIIALRLVPLLPRDTRLQRVDSAAMKIIYPLISYYESTHTSWVVTWGRNRYEQAIRELIREIDTDCFELSRASKRAIAATDTAITSAIWRMVSSRTWMC